jgi:hypothetical protein
MDFDAAVEALVEANAAPEASNTSDAPAPAEQAAAPEAQSETVEQGATPAEADSFTEVDLDSLPPEVRALVEEKFGQFQADYTRKTQEAAPWRKLGDELGIEPGDMREAVETLQRLQTDPEVQRALYKALQEQFASSDDSDDLDLNDEFVDPRDQEIRELQQWRQQMEQEQARARAEAKYDSDVATIRSENPSYQDEDIEAITRLAVASGDMHEAAGVYSALRDRVLGSAFQEKGSVPVGVGGPTPTGHAQQPTRFASLDEADAAAQKLLLADIAN